LLVIPESKPKFKVELRAYIVMLALMV